MKTQDTMKKVYLHQIYIHIEPIEQKQDQKVHRDTSKALVKAGIAVSLTVPSALKCAKVDSQSQEK